MKKFGIIDDDSKDEDVIDKIIKLPPTPVKKLKGQIKKL